MGGSRKAALAAFCVVLAIGLAAYAATPLLEPERPPALQYLAIIIGTIYWAVTLPASLLVRLMFAEEVVAAPLTAWTAPGAPIASPLASTLAVSLVAGIAWALVVSRFTPALRPRIARALVAAVIAALTLTLLQLPYLAPHTAAPTPARIAAAITSPVGALLERAGVPALYRPGSGYVRRMTLSDSTAIHVWATTLVLFLLFSAVTALQR